MKRKTCAGKQSMHARKHDCAPGNTNSRQQVGSVLKFLANFQKSGLDKAKEKNWKICGSISLFVNVTIPGTHGSVLPLLLCTLNKDMLHFLFFLLRVAFADLIFKWHFYPLTDSINQYFFHILKNGFFSLVLLSFALTESQDQEQIHLKKLNQNKTEQIHLFLFLPLFRS